MTNIKELKSIDLSSLTIIGTGIGVLFSILASIIITIIAGIVSPAAISVMIYIIPTIIVGTLMYNIYNIFCEGFLYNILSKKLNSIRFILKEDKEITKVSTTETAIMVAIILTIQIILLYLVSVFILPLLINAVVQTLMFSGQTTIACRISQEDCSSFLS